MTARAPCGANKNKLMIYADKIVLLTSYDKNFKKLALLTLIHKINIIGKPISLKNILIYRQKENVRVSDHLRVSHINQRVRKFIILQYIEPIFYVEKYPILLKC